MAGRARAAGLQRRALRRYSAVSLLEHGVPQQAAGVHQAELNSAVGREFRGVRQAERRAQRHAVRLRGIREGWQSGPQAEEGYHGSRQFYAVQQPAGRSRGTRGPAGRDLSARAHQEDHRGAADGQRQPAAVLRHRRLVPIRVQRRVAALQGYSGRDGS